MRRQLLLAFLLLASAGCGASSSSDPDPKNELPFGFVDLPAAGSPVERNMPAQGWALDDGSVRDVRIFLDNHFAARATLTESRPDVNKAYPKYAHGTDVHGWSVLVPLGADTTAGPHTILVQAVDNQGATKDISTIYVKLEN
jgi:hypothetical protein